MYNYHRIGISSEGIVVILCVCMFAKSQTLAAAAACNTETQGSQDLFCFFFGKSCFLSIGRLVTFL